MKYNPHDYQSYAAGYIESHPISAILLSMGLGKTSITLTAINNLLFDSFDVHKVLIIGPLRVARTTWPDEIRKWDHLSDLQYSVAVGSPSERKAALAKQADIYITNRENVQWLVEDSGFPFDYDMVVVDELSSFKNHQSKRFKALMKVRPRVKRIVGLTGTPSSNGLMDLFAEFKLLDMGERLGRFIGQYRNAYFIPDKRNGQIIFSYKPLPGAEDAIYDKISDITISMKSTDHLKMPELVNSQYMVHLSEEERQRYEELKRDLVLSLPDGEVTAANAASLTGKLSQMANGAVYSDDESIVKIHDQKLDALEDIIEAANGIKGYDKAVQFFPDLVLSDIMMPKRNGLELCSMIKNDIRIGHIPVILMTARSMVMHIREGFEAGADDYVIKPFSMDVLRIRIQSLLQSREQLKKLYGKRFSPEVVGVSTTSADERFSQKLYEIIEKNISDQNLGIEMLCDQIGISRANLYRKIKAISELSPTELIRNKRLEVALRYLKETNMSVSEVATLLGFNSHSYFSNSFKAFYGFTPTEFVQMNSANKEKM